MIRLGIRTNRAHSGRVPEPGRLSKLRLPSALVCALTCMIASACAVSNPEKRPLLGALDRTIQPNDPYVETVMLPIVMPVGLIAGVADMLVVYPASQLAPSAVRINRKYFRKPGESRPRKSALFIPRHFLAVPHFFYAWGVNAYLDVPTPRVSSAGDRPPTPPGVPDDYIPERFDDGSVIWRDPDIPGVEIKIAPITNSDRRPGGTK